MSAVKREPLLWLENISKFFITNLSKRYEHSVVRLNKAFPSAIHRSTSVNIFFRMCVLKNYIFWRKVKLKKKMTSV